MTPTSMAVFLAVGSVDLRGAFDRLAALTREQLGRDPASGALYLFINRRKNRLKAIWWDKNGYVILYKRLSKGCFQVPSQADVSCTCLEISAVDFATLLAGLPLRVTDEEPGPPLLH